MVEPGVAGRVVGAGGQGDGVVLDDGVPVPVDLDVQPRAEVVLVMRAVQIGSDQATVAGGLPVLDGAGGDDAGQLDLELDARVLVEVPVEAVVVVPGGGEERHDQPPGPPDLGVAGAEIGVLPADTGVFLVQADGVRDVDRLAVLVVDDGVQVLDVADAVAAQAQRVGQESQPVLPFVEDVLVGVHRRRIGVRDVHLGE